jgi:hypothetical protein
VGLEIRWSYEGITVRKRRVSMVLGFARPAHPTTPASAPLTVAPAAPGICKGLARHGDE